MKKSIKIIISVLIYPLIMTAYGLIIGGETGILYYAVMIIFAFLLLLFIFGKDETVKKYFLGVVISAVFISHFSSYLYSFVNRSMDDVVINQYNSVVIEMYSDQMGYDHITFTDPKGEIKEHKIFSPGFSITELEENAPIMVYEYKGFFNVENYKIELE